MILSLRESLCSKGLFMLPSWGRMRLITCLTVVIALVGLSGCGPRRVRADFTGYEKSYAETSNHEVLLNLARLEQHDPTYFFKLGQISSSYRMQAGLSGFGQYVPQGSNTGVEVPTGGGTPSAIYENDPAFSFIPVNDEVNAKLLLTPVPEEVFYDLYYQGWRVDQLFRLMVDRIEVTLPAETGGCRVKIIRNVPPPVFKYKDADGNIHVRIDYDHEQASVADYITFLRVSAVVYALQKYGLLQLRGTTSFEPLDENSWLGEDKSKQPPDKPVEASDNSVKVSADHQSVVVTLPPEKSDTGGGKAGPTAKEFDEVAAKDEMWELQDGKWRLGRKVHHTLFQLTSSSSEQGKTLPELTLGKNVSDIENMLRKKIFVEDESLHGLEDTAELTDILEILYNGFAIEGSSEEQEGGMGFCPKEWSKGAPSRLVLRSLIGLMASAAQEQDSFDELKKENRPVPLKDGSAMYRMTADIHKGLLEMDLKNLQAEASKGVDKYKGIDRIEQIESKEYQERAQENLDKLKRFDDLVPSIERVPLLRLDWSQPSDVYPPPAPFATPPASLGLELSYKGQDYVVADADLSNVNIEVPGADGKPPTIKNDYARENQCWNRDMFRLICHLSSQVTVDISKFPLPEVLQLRTE